MAETQIIYLENRDYWDAFARRLFPGLFPRRVPDRHSQKEVREETRDLNPDYGW